MMELNINKCRAIFWIKRSSPNNMINENHSNKINKINMTNENNNHVVIKVNDNQNNITK